MWGRRALAALPALLLLAVDPGGWFAFAPIKGLVLGVVVAFAAASALRHDAVRAPAALLWALGAFLAWLAVAAAVGLDPIYAWTGTPERHLGWITWALLALVLLAATTIDVERDEPALPIGLAVAGLALGGVATLEAIGWEPAVFDVGDRLTATLGSSAYLGAATALLLPAAVGLGVDAGLPRPVRTAGAIAAPLLAVALIGSGARAAWVGLAVAGLVVAWWRRGSIRRHAPVAAIAGGVGIAAVVLVALLTPAGSRAASLTDADAAGGQGRVDEWRVATRVIVDHPLTGVGPEGYRSAFPGAVDAAYERAHGRTEQPDRAHSAPLDVALAGGLPALAAWLALVVIVGRSAWRAGRSGRPLLAGLAAALVAHVVGTLFLFPTAEIDPIAWLLAGVVVANAPPSPPRPWSLPRAVPLAIGALVAVFAVAGVLDVAADRHAGRAVEALDAGRHADASAAALDAVSLRPDEVRLRILAAQAAVADEQGTVVGLHQLDGALDVSPGDPIARQDRLRLLVDRAVATGVPAHVDLARSELDAELRRDPHHVDLWRLRARLATAEGDDALAKAANATADDLEPNRDAGRG